HLHEKIQRMFLWKETRRVFDLSMVDRSIKLLAVNERLFLSKLHSVFTASLTDNLEPASRQALEYCAKELPRAVLRAAYLRRQPVRGLLDEGVLKLLMGFFSWHPGPIPARVIEEVRDCLDLYPGERNAVILDSPASIIMAR